MSHPTRISSGYICLKHALRLYFFDAWRETHSDWDKTAPSRQNKNTTDFTASIFRVMQSYDKVTWFFCHVTKIIRKPLVLTPEWFSVADPGISRFTRSHPKDRPFIYYSRLLLHVRVPRTHCVLSRIPWGSHHLSYTATRGSVLRRRPQKPRRRVTTGLAKSFSLKSACRAMTCTSSNLRWLSYMSG